MTFDGGLGGRSLFIVRCSFSEDSVGFGGRIGFTIVEIELELGQLRGLGGIIGGEIVSELTSDGGLGGSGLFIMLPSFVKCVV